MDNKQLMLAVMAQLEREKTVSIPQLASMLDASEDQVFEALETLVFAYDAASMRLDLHDTYATLITHGKERLLRLTAAETDALVDALIAAGFSDDDDLVRSLIHTKSLLNSDVPTSKSRMRIISDKPSADTAEALAAACEDADHHLLEIAYQGSDDAKPKTRRVEPLRIISDEGHRYLQAYCLEANGWRSFRIERIAQAKQLESVFSPREPLPAPSLDFDGSCMDARILFDANCPIPSWHGLRVSKHKDGESYTGTIKWTGSSWLPKHIVALMGKAVPLQPNSLVDACSEYAESLLQAAHMHEHSCE